MNKIAVGDRVPDFRFDCTDPKIHSFNSLLGKNIVLYFYPKDNTPGCTKEGKDFSTLYQEFSSLNTQILGVSRDSLDCHQKFCEKLRLPFPLITDKNEKLCQYFDVVIKNNFLLRLILGIERVTFLIDAHGVIRHIWRKVKVRGHAQEVLHAVKKLNS